MISKSRTTARKPPQPADSATVSDLCQQANELRHRNELETALQVAEQALDEASTLSNPELTGECLLTLADIHHDREDYSMAQSLYQQALLSFREAGVERGQGEAHLGLGIVCLDRGNLEEAERSLFSALELAQRVDDPALEGAACVNLGLLYTDWGQLEEARSYHEQAIQLFEALGSDWGIATQYTNLALIYVRLGQIEEARAYHERALTIDLEIGNQRGVATDYGNLGDVCYDLGDLDQAEAFYQHSLEHARSIGYRQQEGRAHNGLALVAVSQDDVEAARDHYTAALGLFQEIGFRQGEAGAHVDLGYALALCGDVEEGLHHCWRGLEIYRALDHREGEIAAHLCLGYISLILTDDLDQVIAHYARAREIAIELQNPDLIWRVYVGLGSSYYRAGRFSEAYQAYCQAAEAVESIRLGLWQEESKLGFIGSKRGLYAIIVKLCILRWAAGEDLAVIEALEYLERGKSRAFLDLLGHTAIRAPVGVDAAWLERERATMRQIRALSRALSGASAERRMHLLQRASEARQRLDTLLDDIAQDAPEYVDLQRSQPLSFDRLCQMLASW